MIVYSQLPVSGGFFAAQIRQARIKPTEELKRKAIDTLAIKMGNYTEHNLSQKNLEEALYRLRGTIVKRAMPGMIKQYGGSVISFVVSTHPESAWKPWKFGSSPRGWWKDVSSLLRRGDPVAKCILLDYLEHLRERLQNTSIDASSVPQLLSNPQAIYQKLETLLDPIETMTTEDFVSDSKLRYKFAEGLAKSSYDDLYSVSISQFLQAGGPIGALKTNYASSVANFVMCELVDHSWKPWKFFRTPEMWWNDLSDLWRKGDAVVECVVRNWLDDVATNVNIRLPEEWSKIPQSYTKSFYYFGTVKQVMQRLYPHYEWDEPNQGRDALVPRTIYASFHSSGSDDNSSRSRRRDLDSIRTLLGGSFDSLYSCSLSILQQARFLRIIRLYNSSLTLAIKTEYPEHHWREWKFKLKAQKLWWLNLRRLLRSGDEIAKAVTRLWLEDVQEELGIVALDQWTRISQRAEFSHRLLSTFQTLGGLRDVLLIAYPTYPWNKHPFTRPNKKGTQHLIYKHLQKGFPGWHLLKSANG